MKQHFPIGFLDRPLAIGLVDTEVVPEQKLSPLSCAWYGYLATQRWLVLICWALVEADVGP